MSKVYTGASMSLDGYIAGPGESGFDHLFEWYFNGDVEVPTASDMTFKLSRASADYLTGYISQTGSLVVGRRLFDLVKGWGGRHPLDRTVVVLTHSVPEGWAPADENFVFVTEGIEAAVAKAAEIAGDQVVGVNGGTIARQCLDAGLLDEVWVDLVPVLLGSGTPFFEQLGTAPVLLDGPVSIVPGDRVTHLRYEVRK
ncbi:dihydrofolate reductase [Hamadaea flava]|uniref:Dihydrofolate reductase family protein n=1 Tax=Hamadaea flava TaxID=1742688 RepID=A0ABV8LP75_9ACTN|nr:dihydrofolate reductase family protein [Hamadaea flava]MCP2322832.1 dihydrofolate reductase [Hamadaea flava]